MSRAHQRHRRQTDGIAIAYSERNVVTVAKNDELPIARLHSSCFLTAWRTQSIYRLWLCSKTVLPEYVSATGSRQKISIYVGLSVVHTHSLAAPCWIFNVCDVVIKRLLGLPRFQILLLIVYDYINTISAIIQRLFRQNKLWQLGWMGVGA